MVRVQGLALVRSQEGAVCVYVSLSLWRFSCLIWSTSRTVVIENRALLSTLVKMFQHASYQGEKKKKKKKVETE